MRYFNLVSNFSVRIILGLTAFLVVPFFLKIVGIEKYGMIAFYNILVTFFILFDFGLMGALNREVAILYYQLAYRQRMLNLIKTVETTFWLFSLALAILCMGFSYLIFQYHTFNSLDYFSLIRISCLISLALSLQIPFSIYSNVFMGMEKQIPINLITLIFGLLKHIGGICVLIWINTRIETFFIYQICINALQNKVARETMKLFLSDFALKAKFTWIEIKRLSSYATGYFFISLCSFFIMNIDKFILIYLTDLKTFSSYITVYNLSTVQTIICLSIFTTYFPGLTRYAAQKEIEFLRKFYHNYSQIASSLFFPISFLLFFFPREFIYLWIQDQIFIENVYGILKYLSIGNLLNTLLTIPTTLPFAFGETKYVLKQMIVSLLVLIPTTYWVTYFYGSKGIAQLWVAYQIVCFLIMAPFFQKRYLNEKYSISLFKDILYPGLSSLGIILVAKFTMNIYLDVFNIVFKLGIIGVLAILSSVISTEYFRKKMFDWVSQMFKYGKVS